MLFYFGHPVTGVVKKLATPPSREDELGPPIAGIITCNRMADDSVGNVA